MNETKYTYAVAYMKTLENKMLTANETETLILSENIDYAIKTLTDKGFGQSLTGNETVNEILKSELEKVWTEAKNVCPEGAPLDILLYQNDFHNLKTVLKASVTGVGWENLILRPCLVEPELIEDAIKNVNFENLPEFIKEPCENAFKLIAETNDGQLAEVYLDKQQWTKMKARADKEKNEFLSGWIDLNIIIANMKTAFRAVGKSKDFISVAMIDTDKINIDRLIEASLSSHQSVLEAISAIGYPAASEELSESFSAFEKWCDNKKMEYIKKAKMKSFGFEPILAFLIGKEFELQTIRIILSGKQNNIPAEIIRERLRDLYV